MWSAPRLFIVAASLLLLTSGCALFAGRHWEETRRDVIEPINSALHRHLPRDLKAGDLDAVLGAYAVETGSGPSWDDAVVLSDGFRESRTHWAGSPVEETLRSRYQHVLALFDTVDKAEVRIHRIHWDEQTPAGHPAEVRLLMRGTKGDERRVLDQRARVAIDRRHGHWVITAEDVTFRELVATSEPRFEVATSAAGIDSVHDVEGSPPFRLLGDIRLSSGVAIADFDCDGYEDLALLGSSRIALYRNAADGTFTDATVESGLAEPLDIAGTGLVFFDADNDGDPDLWISGIRGDRFYRNQGCGRFADVTTEAGVPPARWSSMPIVADYDRDGFLDVYVVRMGDHETTAPTPNWDARNGVGDSLYRNNGDGTFTDVTEDAGITSRGWGLAGAWGDYDGDGYPDVYVGNEFGTNSLYRNNRDGTFTEVAAEAGAIDRGAAMGVSWGDYDGDGDLDLFVSNMYANSRWALFHPEFPPPVPWYFSWVPRSSIDVVTDELSRGSTLLRNDGDSTFTDVSDAAGIRDGQWGWGAAFLDYDNDGHLDVFAANGFISGPLLDDV